MIIKKIKTKFHLYLQLISYLSKRQANQLLLLFFLISVGALLELFTVVLIIPFLNVLNGEDLPLIIKNTLNKFLVISTLEDKNLILIIATIVLFFALFSSLFRIIITILKERYIANIVNYLSTKAFNKIINQKYIWHLQNESSEIISKIDCIDAISSKILSSAILLFSAIFTSLIILFGMLIYSFKTTFSALFLVSFCYYLFLLWCKNRLDKNSIERVKERKDLLKIKKDSLNGIREIIINNEKEFILKPYKFIDKKLRDHQAELGYLNLFPKYIIEFLAILVILVVGIIAFYNPNKTETIITAIAFFSISLLKLIPQIQSLYSALTQMRANNKALSEFLDLLSLNSIYKNRKGLVKKFNTDIFSIKNLTYLFPYSDRILFKDLNLELRKGDFIALSGKSGSGKTTLCDILMGLIEPSKATFNFYNSTQTHEVNSYDLRKNSVHVPQEVFLFNDTIEKNIIRTSHYDKNAMKISIYTSCLEDFVKSSAQGIKTKLGERGSLISGGQRQRIGLARAIYSMLTEEKLMMFLDESTSALDSITEIKAIKRLKKLSKDKIIVFISHRKNTFHMFNRIIDLDQIKK